MDLDTWMRQAACKGSSAGIESGVVAPQVRGPMLAGPPDAVAVADQDT